jgi:hypothetical protein
MTEWQTYDLARRVGSLTLSENDPPGTGGK